MHPETTKMEAAADLILANARAYTVDARNPWVEEIALRRGKIIHVGPAGSAHALRGAETKIVDLKGRMVLPGLGDVHNHHMRGGQLDLFELSFPASVTFDQILALVHQRAAKG